ncbi:response regulator transcription factor [Paenibacillus thalictri]|uniref:Response regulator n=1 Tax=Paenibacillus thalictri TaxID=2527873 RepID=A0A4Q9DGN4_9BACL|nr:response regulator [Paenibacillus thalictri]TBL71404.1 response regulator [Paenibacillus thalictri]
MGMFSLFIADDEKWVRQGLRQTINWQAEGIEPIGEAADGQEALEFIAAHAPDILITDIKMPGMDGLELMAALKRQHIRTKVIFISGYTDFSYAQSAVKLGAYDYVVKPIEEEVLLEVVRRCTADLKKEHAEAKLLEQMTHSIRESLPLARQRLLEKLLFQERQRTSSGLLEKWESLGLKLDPANIEVIAVSVQNWGIKGDDEKSRSLTRIGLANIGEEVGGSLGTIIGCPLDDQEIDVVLLLSRSTSPALSTGPAYPADPGNSAGPAEPFPLQPLLSKLEALISAARTYLGVEVNAGVSRTCDVSDLALACKEAMHALSYSFLGGSASVYAAEQLRLPMDHNTNGSDYSGLGDAWLNRFTNSIKLGEDGTVTELLESLRLHLQSCAQSYTPIQLSRGLSAILKNIAGRLDAEGQTDNGTHSDISKLRRELATAKVTLPEFTNTLLPLFSSLGTLYRSQNSNRRTVQLAIEYICRHDLREITMQEVALHVSLNPSYFSKVFHDETGETFSKFVIRQRVDRAKKLLKLTTMKVYEIAEQIGYSDLRHFVRVFKENEGITPSQYRDKC